MVYSPFTTSGQETEWVYSYNPGNPHGANRVKAMATYLQETRITNAENTTAVEITITIISTVR